MAEFTADDRLDRAGRQVEQRPIDVAVDHHLLEVGMAGVGGGDVGQRRIVGELLGAFEPVQRHAALTGRRDVDGAGVGDPVDGVETGQARIDPGRGRRHIQRVVQLADQLRMDGVGAVALAIGQAHVELPARHLQEVALQPDQGAAGGDVHRFSLGRQRQDRLHVIGERIEGAERGRDDRRHVGREEHGRIAFRGGAIGEQALGVQLQGRGQVDTAVEIAGGAARRRLGVDVHIVRIGLDVGVAGVGAVGRSGERHIGERRRLARGVDEKSAGIEVVHVVGLGEGAVGRAISITAAVVVGARSRGRLQFQRALAARQIALADGRLVVMLDAEHEVVVVGDQTPIDGDHIGLARAVVLGTIAVGLDLQAVGVGLGDDVDHAADGVRAIHRRGPVLEDLVAVDHVLGDDVEVGGGHRAADAIRVQAATVQQHQGAHVAEAPQGHRVDAGTAVHDVARELLVQLHRARRRGGLLQHFRDGQQTLVLGVGGGDDADRGRRVEGGVADARSGDHHFADVRGGLGGRRGRRLCRGRRGRWRCALVLGHGPHGKRDQHQTTQATDHGGRHQSMSHRCNPLDRPRTTEAQH